MAEKPYREVLLRAGQRDCRSEFLEAKLQLGLRDITLQHGYIGGRMVLHEDKAGVHEASAGQTVEFAPQERAGNCVVSRNVDTDVLHCLLGRDQAIDFQSLLSHNLQCNVWI